MQCKEQKKQMSTVQKLWKGEEIQGQLHPKVWVCGAGTPTPTRADEVLVRSLATTNSMNSETADCSAIQSDEEPFQGSLRAYSFNVQSSQLP
jgi:hypothetical protein